VNRAAQARQIGNYDRPAGPGRATCRVRTATAPAVPCIQGRPVRTEAKFCSISSDAAVLPWRAHRWTQLDKIENASNPAGAPKTHVASGNGPIARRTRGLRESRDRTAASRQPRGAFPQVRPCALGRRRTASGAVCAGSNPAGRAGRVDNSNTVSILCRDRPAKWKPAGHRPFTATGPAPARPSQP
jgi:hypothetical protein